MEEFKILLHEKCPRLWDLNHLDHLINSPSNERDGGRETGRKREREKFKEMF